MSDIESEDEQVHQPSHPELVEVDVTALTPLSPEVISKQVDCSSTVYHSSDLG